MIDLPDLLLSHGITLKSIGNTYMCKCFAHDDNTTSMSVYRNDDGKWVANCFGCGFNGSVIDVYCYLNGMNPENPEHSKQAKNALSTGNYTTGQPYAVIHSDTPANILLDRTMIVPPKNTPPPKMHLHQKNGVALGEPVDSYIYRQPNGDPWYYEARWMMPGADGKAREERRYFTWGRRGSAPPKWGCTPYPSPRPLYGLDVLATKPQAQVVVCKDPREAFAAQQLLPVMVCVGWAGGASEWDKSDWGTLAGRNCVLWPNADEVVREAMAGIAQVLVSQGCNVYVLDTNDKPMGWGAANALKDGWDTAQTIAWAKAHKGQPVKVSAGKKPLDKVGESNAENMIDQSDVPDESIYTLNQLPPEPESPQENPVADLLPIEIYAGRASEHTWSTDPFDFFSEFVVPQLQPGLLPDVIENHIFDISEVINADPAFGALTAVATVAGLLDDRIKIHLNQGYNESARLWTMCVGEPSTKKSPIMDAVRIPLSEIKKRYAKEEEKIRQRQAIIDARYKAKLKEYTAACIESDNHSVHEPLPPEKLTYRRIECDNLTREALEETLRNMPYGVIIHADELAGWLGSMDAYKAAGVKADRALWLRAYNGGPMQVDRIGRGSYMIENWSATITGGIQPSRLRSLAWQMDDDGLLQRFIIVSSSRDGGQGLSRARNEHAFIAWKNLLENVVEMRHGGGVVNLSQEAAAIRNSAVKEIYDMIKSRMISPAFTTAMGKWEGTTGRMILTFHAVDCAVKGMHPESAVVSGETSQRAIDYMMKHLLQHMVSFYEDGLGQSASHECAKTIAGRIIALGQSEIRVRDLQNSGPRKWRDATEDVQRQALVRLCEYGWLHPVDGIANIARRPSRYLVNPHVHVIHARHKAAEIARIEQARDIAEKIKSGGQNS